MSLRRDFGITNKYLLSRPSGSSHCRYIIPSIISRDSHCAQYAFVPSLWLDTFFHVGLIVLFNFNCNNGPISESSACFWMISSLLQILKIDVSSFELFVPQAYERLRATVEMHDQFAASYMSSIQVIMEMFNSLQHSQQLSSCDAIILFRTTQHSTEVRNYFFLAILFLWQDCSYSFFTGIGVHYKSSIRNWIAKDWRWRKQIFETLKLVVTFLGPYIGNVLFR